MKKFVVFIVSALLLSGCASFRGTLTGVGVDNTPNPSPLTKVAQEVRVKPVWMISAGSSMGPDAIKLGPIVTDNIVFTADPRGGVTATNPRNGKRVWWTNTRAPITSGPTIREGLVVVGTNDGRVFALRETNGSILWHANVSNAVLAAPQIGQGRVIVKTIDGKLLALDAQSGQQLWTYDHGAPIMVMRRDNSPQIFGNEVITAFTDGKLAAFNLSQGQLLWEKPISTVSGISQIDQMVDVLADPIISRGVIYLATYQGQVFAMNAFTGNLLWQNNDSACGYTNMTLGWGLLFATDVQDHIKAFDLETGNLVWEQPLLAYRHLSPMVIIGSRFVVGDYAGYLHWFAQQDGHYAGRTLVENGVRITAPSTLLGNYFYVSGANGNLSAWRVG